MSAQKPKLSPWLVKEQSAENIQDTHVFKRKWRVCGADNFHESWFEGEKHTPK